MLLHQQCSLIVKALEVKEQEMEEHLAQQREEMEERLAQQREEHRLDMDAIIRRFAAQMVTYDACFRSLEGAIVVSSEPEVTTKRDVHNLGSPTCPIIRSFADSTQETKLFFYYQFIRRSSSVIEYHDNE
jgi:hypothetical protein